MIHRSSQASPLRVLMLTPRFLPHIGGVERHVDGLAAQLAKRGLDVTVLTVKEEERQPDRETREGYRVLRMPHGGRKSWLWFLRNLAVLLRADIIHCHDFSTFFTWYLPFRFLLPWIPVYVTFHGFEKYPPDSLSVKRRRLTASLSQGYLCVGYYIARWYDTPCLRVVLGATSREADESIRRKNAGVVFIGRLEPDTAPEGLILALSILRQRFGIAIDADVCGDGSLRSTLERLARTLDVRVRFHGVVEDIGPIVSESMFAVPSGYLAMLESMALGSAVLVYAPNPLRRDYWCLPGLAGRALLLASTPEELATCLAELITNTSATENLVAAGLQFARTQTWDRLADNYLQLYGVRT